MSVFTKVPTVPIPKSMAKKKAQHIVPKAYLKHFVYEPISENGKPFTPGLFVNTPSLSRSWKYKSLGNRIFTETRFYNLNSDAPEQPVIEDYLASIESEYSSSIKKLLGGVFSNEILSSISIFVAIQLIRTKRSIISQQRAWDNISECADMLEGDGKNQAQLSEIAKKQLLYIARTPAANKLHKASVIMFNMTKIPFLTSDNPVVRNFYNHEDISSILAPIRIEKYLDKHLETPFFFMPITPWVAYISHDALKSENKGLTCEHAQIVERLNDLTILNADKYIYSLMDEPVKNPPVSFPPIDNIYTLWAKAFTKSKRYIWRVKSYKSKPGSLMLISFESCSDLLVGEQISSIEVYDANFSEDIGRTGLKNCKVAENNIIEKMIVFEIPPKGVLEN